MKKPLIFISLIFVSILTGCINGGDTQLKVQESPVEIDETNKSIVISIVKDFGDRLKRVSLLAPRDILEKNMTENYGDLVSSELLNKWIKDPLNAPGRLTSSPWPDRIEIIKIEKISEYVYKVSGKIIEITSKEMTSGGIAASRPITLIVKKVKDKWVIDNVTLGEYE